jgi:YcxB-like protein
VKINCTKDHVFLMFSRLGGLIVPRRIFNSPDQEERFAAFSRSKAPSSA